MIKSNVTTQSDRLHLSVQWVRGSLLALIVLICCHTTLQAVPMADYHRNLQQAITALDTLSQIDEGESSSEYQKRISETLAAIRNAVPPTQAVQAGQEICNVDNSWLSSKLDEFEKAPESERPPIVKQIIERLQAIDERMQELKGPGTQSLNKAEANEKLSAILSRPEYAQKPTESSAIARLWHDLLRWLTSLFPKRQPLAPGQAGLFSLVAEILVVSLATGVIVYLIWMFAPRLFSARKRKIASKVQARIVLGERLEPEASAVDLLADAEALARRGEVRAAIRKAYIALLVELADRKVISLAQHKTNRDYLRSVSSMGPLYSQMNYLTESFERHWYGLSQATETDWQEFRTRYKAALQ